MVVEKPAVRRHDELKAPWCGKDKGHHHPSRARFVRDPLGGQGKSRDEAVDAIVTLGAVIVAGTAHFFEYVRR